MWLYVDSQNRECGPVSDVDLVRLVDAGVVTRDTLVRRDTETQRYQAGGLPGLFRETLPPVDEPRLLSEPPFRKLKENVYTLNVILLVCAVAIPLLGLFAGVSGPVAIPLCIGSICTGATMCLINCAVVKIFRISNTLEDIRKELSKRP
ncbi:MAG: GYF domain-containing protein [Thermoguttaceae bacterium]|nr:GYF domain-containing protein [Thermoguttaceae bacterium]